MIVARRGKVRGSHTWMPSQTTADTPHQLEAAVAEVAQFCLKEERYLLPDDHRFLAHTGS
jgi:hypothetical protein